MATNLNFHFDPELFLVNWRAAVDPTLTALYQSGAVVNDDTIRQMIANGGNFYTIPQYTPLTADTPQNYDGATNVSAGETTDVAQSGVVFSRMKAWKARDFIRDFNRADPMGSITGQVAKWWNKYRQTLMLGLLNAVFSIGTNAAWNEHSTDITASGQAATIANNYCGATTIGDAIQKACGDNKGIFGLAVMHSKVATNLANLNLLDFRKYTDAAGITRTLNIADVNGLTVVVDDGVPAVIDPLTYQATSDSAIVAGKTYYTRSGGGPYTYTAVASPVAADLASYYEVATSNVKYTTYLLGSGSILRADAPIEHPVETVRDAITNGGQETLITRVRETMHVNGLSFVPPGGMAASPADSVLTTSGNWSLVADPKTIALARIITNG